MNKVTKLLARGAGIATASYATYVTTTFLRYGHPRRASGEAADSLLDPFMRVHDVCERHHIAVDAPADVTLAAAKELELDGSRIIRALFKGRELLLGSKPDTTKRPKGLVAQMTSFGWRLLAETPDREMVFGAVTKPWEPNPVFRPIAPEEFAAFAEPDYVKIAWTLRADPQPDGSSVFRTETRAVATDAGARKKFRVYWSFLSPGIIIIRAAMLPALRAAAEKKMSMMRPFRQDRFAPRGRAAPSRP